MSQKSSLYRTIEILKMLNEGKKLCVSQLAMSYEVSDRTIRRDFELIKELFGDFMSKEGECYRAYQKVLLEEVLSAKDLMTLANIVNLFGLTSMQSNISEETEALVKKSLTVYDFKSRPFENMQKHEVIKDLEHAIKFSKEVKIHYQTARGEIQKYFHPYRILFLNENFYLVGENHTKNKFQFLRVSMIVGVSFTKKSFFHHQDIKKFIETIQTPWADFGKPMIKVRLRFDRKVAKYFILKKFLPSQEVVHTFENRDIEVNFHVTNLREVDDLVIKWLPHVRVIAPRGLHRMVKKTLNKKLTSLGLYEFPKE
jgi:predicted DNA-binding transcriptional regulator YafY